MRGGPVRPRGPVHQILILEEGAPHPAHPTEVAGAVHAAFGDYRLWTRDALATFLDEAFGSRVLAAFERVRPFAYKADLARYCLLHHFGGWYFDYGLRGIAIPSDLPPVDLIAFRDRQAHSHTSWAVQCGLLYARPGLPALREAVDICVENIERGYYGPTSLSPTGPDALGRAVAGHGPETTMLLGDFVDLTPQHRRDNLAFVGPDGWIWALYKATPPGRNGLPGENWYNDMWQQGLVYSVDPAADRPGMALAEPYRAGDAIPSMRVRSLVLAALRDRLRMRRSR